MCFDESDDPTLLTKEYFITRRLNSGVTEKSFIGFVLYHGWHSMRLSCLFHADTQDRITRICLVCTYFLSFLPISPPYYSFMPIQCVEIHFQPVDTLLCLLS